MSGAWQGVTADRPADRTERPCSEPLFFPMADKGLRRHSQRPSGRKLRGGGAPLAMLLPANGLRAFNRSGGTADTRTSRAQRLGAPASATGRTGAMRRASARGSAIVSRCAKGRSRWITQADGASRKMFPRMWTGHGQRPSYDDTNVHPCHAGRCAPTLRSPGSHHRSSPRPVERDARDADASKHRADARDARR